MSERPMTNQEWYQILRNQIIISYDNSKELALRNFDQIALKLSEQLKINELLKTIKEQTVDILPSTTGTVSELPKKKK